MDEATPSFRIGTWNLERQGTPDRLELIESNQLDVLLAQEVTEAAHDAIRSSGLFDWSAFSLHFRPRSVRNSRSERLGVAVFGRRPLHPRASGILEWIRRPEKLVFAELEVPGWREPVTLASYHASPGDGKPECTLQVAHWLELQFGPAILGLDANSPDVDHPDYAQSVFHWQQDPFAHCEPALIGPPGDRRHRLDDALRLWLVERPEELGQIVESRPNGPLACTYDRGSGGRAKPSRFDSIWVSPEFRVESIAHLWDDEAGVPAGGSDHAMVVAQLCRPPVSPRAPGQQVVDHVIGQGLLESGAELHLAIDLIENEGDRMLVEQWLAADPTRRLAGFTSVRGRPLEWAGGAGTFTLRGLVEHICEAAGAGPPAGPPGPHWWRAADGRSLVQVSDGVR